MIKRNSIRFNAVFEFKTFEDAEEAHKKIGKLTKNISGISRLSKQTLMRRCVKILNLLTPIPLSTRQIFNKLKDRDFTYRTLQRDLKYLILLGKVKHKQTREQCLRNWFWREQ